MTAKQAQHMRPSPSLEIADSSKLCIYLASPESSSWNTLLTHVKTLDSLRQRFMVT